METQETAWQRVLDHTATEADLRKIWDENEAELAANPKLRRCPDFHDQMTSYLQTIEKMDRIDGKEPTLADVLKVLIERENTMQTKQAGTVELTEELRLWQESQNLPRQCALEQQFFNQDLTNSQREWLADFSRRWEAAQDAEDEQRQGATMLENLKRRGFMPEHVGGGCSLLSLYSDSGARVWISCTSGPAMPEPDNWLVIAYSPAEDCEGVLSISSGEWSVSSWPHAVDAAVAFMKLY